MEEGIPPPTLDVADSVVWAGRELVKRVDRDLAGQGLGWGQLRALLALEDQRGWIHAGAVGRRIGVSRQAAHVLLRRLDDRGFLRWMDEGWIRSARLTPEGERAVRTALKTVWPTFEAIERLTVAERKMLVSATYSLHRELRRPPPNIPWYVDKLPEYLREEYQQ